MAKAPAQKRVILIMGSRYIDRIHYGVAQYAGRKRWHLTNLFGDDPYLIRERECDGIIAALGKEDPLSSTIVRRRKPTVSVSIAHNRLKIPHITGDNEAMGQAAAMHFLERGFRRFIWYSETFEASAKLRLQGYRSVLQERGLDCAMMIHEKAFPKGRPKWRELAGWIQQSVKDGGLPCAVYAFNDSQAVNFLDACVAGGIQVPDEAAVLGTDNNLLVCPTAAVPLSSINHDLDEVGRRAAEELERLMDGGSRRHELIEIPHRGITVRQSSDVFAVNDPQVSHALRFIYENFQRSIGVEQVAGAAGLTRRALERRFQRHLNASILSKLNRLRLDHSCRLLRESDWTISEIAARSGFATVEYYHRFFKQRMGVTPRKYRSTFKTSAQKA